MIRKINRRKASRLERTVTPAWRGAGEGSGGGSSERVLGHEYRQPYDGAASEVDDVVDRDHLQVQHHLPGAFDGPGQDQRGAHVAGLLRGGGGEECEE